MAKVCLDTLEFVVLLTKKGFSMVQAKGLMEAVQALDLVLVRDRKGELRGIEACHPNRAGCERSVQKLARRS